MDAERVHRSVIDVLVVTEAPRCASFGELLRRLPGVPPDEAASAVDRLASAGLVDTATVARLALTARPPDASGDGDADDDVLPPPHPLDYDWRFTPRTAGRLAATCARLAAPGELIALLGTPTVLHAAIFSPQGRRWLLLESSPATTGALSQRILARHGMRVTVRAYPDQEFFEVYSEIELAEQADLPAEQFMTCPRW